MVELLISSSKQAGLRRTLDRLGHNRRSRPVPDDPEGSSSSRKTHKVRQRLQPETIQQLVSDYEAGNSTIMLMRIYGIGKSTVLRLLADAGVEMRRPGLAAQHDAEAVALYVAGWSAAQVGDKFGTTADTVLVIVHRAGKPVRPRVGGPQGRRSGSQNQ